LRVAPIVDVGLLSCADARDRRVLRGRLSHCSVFESLVERVFGKSRCGDRYQRAPVADYALPTAGTSGSDVDRVPLRAGAFAPDTTRSRPARFRSQARWLDTRDDHEHHTGRELHV